VSTTPTGCVCGPATVAAALMMTPAEHQLECDVSDCAKRLAAWCDMTEASEKSSVSSEMPISSTAAGSRVRSELGKRSSCAAAWKQSGKKNRDETAPSASPTTSADEMSRLTCEPGSALQPRVMAKQSEQMTLLTKRCGSGMPVTPR